MAPQRISEPCRLLAAALLVLLLSTAVTAAADAPNTSSGGNQTQVAATPPQIRTFVPGERSIHSDQVRDATNGRNGEVLFATAFGLSEYNRTWSTRHVTRGNVSEGLLDDFVTAVEYDGSGNLWIGYPNGLQVYDGKTYRTFRDQQLLKELRILALQRWGDAMWVATGNAGIHRYLNGTWAWYQPQSKGGPGFYEVDSLAVDPASGALLIATARDGVWTVPSPGDPVVFRQIDPAISSPPPLWHVRTSPLGGAYIFDETTVRSYSAVRGWAPVLTVSDLTQKITEINDCAAAPDGTLYLATDDGIYAWQDGRVVRNLKRFDGIGTSDIVRWISVDAKGRVWFATQGSVGYYQPPEPPGVSGTITVISVAADGGMTAPAPAVTATTAVPEAPVTMPTAPLPPAREPSLLERLTKVLRGIFPQIFPGT